MSENIGFISTRFAGTDGVSLESSKWAEVLWYDNHRSFWYGGSLDRAENMSLCVPEAFFQHPENEWIDQRIWGHTHRSPHVTRRIHDLTEYLKSTIYDFVNEFDISVVVIQNALTIPMHLPLGLAITEFLAETVMPAIAHHHDFYWERSRFQVSNVGDFLDMAFPPRDIHLQHVVINQTAREELALRKGISSMLIPNVLDFDGVSDASDDFCRDIRKDIGLTPEDILVLQPTRVVPRKGIEHSISLLRRLDDPRYKLVVTHSAGDEGQDYLNQIIELANFEGVDLRFFGHRIGDRRQMHSNGDKIYILEDLYKHSDLVMFPSIYEGFGNAFLEAVIYRRPIVINRYPVWVRDIEPKKFKVPVMDGFINREVVSEVKHIMEDDEYRNEMVNHNFNIAQHYYSYRVLRYGLQTLISNIKNQM
ncbi:MAG: glycosyltransferase family 4 protein [Deltaproteobacteria bacterium]|nr:glycosyltransferase family 4 protein [Deltaproteobacteria bacterium]MBT6499711.1 glycosyltransferase family 4 protein [Deltaproteobacteria bacterium]MBT7154462.1 glycosyltransferase family 4 protein [Deltaproteobacteria bacterium]MBT7713151.1 glycosyltransferase family 4 protein [Deltaproteobacteria bacterium]